MKRLHESEAGSVGLASLDVNKDTPLLDSLCVHVLIIIARHQHQNMASEWDFFFLHMVKSSLHTTDKHTLHRKITEIAYTHWQTNPTTLRTPREHTKHGSQTGTLHGTNRI